MNPRLRIAGITAAFALGFAARMMASPSPVAQAVSPLQTVEEDDRPTAKPSRAAAAMSPTHPKATQPSSHDEALALQQRLDALNKALAVAEEAVTTTAGTPINTPDDLPHVFTEAGVEQELTAMLDELGAGRIVHLDCGEFPCIAQVVFDLHDADELMPLQERFLALHGDSPYGTHGRAWPFWMTEPESNKPALIGISLSLHGEMAPEHSERVEFRIQEALSMDSDRLARERIGEATP